MASDSENEQRLYEDLLSQHIERKISAALKRKFGHDGDILRQNSENNPEESAIRPKAEIIPSFDPDSRHCTVTSWLQKIEQLGQIHSWSDYEKICYMQVKLKGAARDWFNRIEDYDKSWEEWKTALSRAFPRCVDYASVLEELVARKKESSESMTHYYHAKLDLTQQCRLDNDATISCIIKGLPIELQANARAFQCTNPDELYSGFIAPMDNYKSLDMIPPKRARFQDPASTSSPHRRLPQCYSCGKLGHLARECHSRGSIRCYLCKRIGHKKENCRLSTKLNKETNEKVVKLIDSDIVNRAYKKTCFVNGQKALGYLDSGSQVNIISKHIVQKFNLTTIPKTHILRGFGGSRIVANEETAFTLHIDDITVNTTAVVTNIGMDELDMIIGQPVINSNGVVFIVGAGETKLTTDIINTLSKITLVGQVARPKVILSKNVHVNPGTESAVEVQVLNLDEGKEAVIENRVYKLSRALIGIPSGVIASTSTEIIIQNLGEESLNLEKGHLIARGSECEVASGVDTLMVRLTDSLVCKRIEAHEIDIDTFLDSNSKDDLLKILNKWSNSFAKGSLDLGTIKEGELKITLENDAKPVCYRPYRL